MTVCLLRFQAASAFASWGIALQPALRTPWRGVRSSLPATDPALPATTLTASPGAILTSGRLACKGEGQDIRNKSESSVRYLRCLSILIKNQVSNVIGPLGKLGNLKQGLADGSMHITDHHDTHLAL